MNARLVSLAGAGVLLLSGCAFDSVTSAPDAIPSAPSPVEVSNAAPFPTERPNVEQGAAKVPDVDLFPAKVPNDTEPPRKVPNDKKPPTKVPNDQKPPVMAPDARPDSQIPEAHVPIADVAPEAQGVNKPRPEQAKGIRMTSDRGRGLKADDVSDTALAGGCVPGYGRDGQCLPPIPPRLAAEHAGHVGMDGQKMAMFYTCEDVRALIPGGLATEEDPLGLDSNEDGIACGKGDSK